MGSLVSESMPEEEEVCEEAEEDEDDGVGDLRMPSFADFSKSLSRSASSSQFASIAALNHRTMLWQARAKGQSIRYVLFSAIPWIMSYLHDFLHGLQL